MISIWTNPIPSFVLIRAHMTELPQLVKHAMSFCTSLLFGEFFIKKSPFDIRLCHCPICKPEGVVGQYIDTVGA